MVARTSPKAAVTTGQVAAYDPRFATQVGVDAAEGADQLGQQAAHIEVAKSELRRSAT